MFVADIEYRAWTEDEKLRHPSFKGIRERADEGSVFSLWCPATDYEKWLKQPPKHIRDPKVP